MFDLPDELPRLDHIDRLAERTLARKASVRGRLRLPSYLNHLP